jgi:hypothetical protein
MQTAPHGVLSLDTATRTGWCYGTDARAVPAWGVIVLAGIADVAASWVGLDNELTDLIAVLQPRKVIYEAPFTYTAGARDPLVPYLLLGLGAHVESSCYRAGMPCFRRHVGTARKLVLGRGNFTKPLHGEGRMRGGTLRGDPKEEVRLWCDDIGWSSIADHNARDAAVLLRHELLFAEAPPTAGAERAAA